VPTLEFVLPLATDGRQAAAATVLVRQRGLKNPDEAGPLPRANI